MNRAGPHREERTRRLRRELGGETRKRAWMAGQGVKPLNRLPSAGISSVSTWPQRWPRLGSAAQHPTMLETCKTCGRSWRMKDTRCGVTAGRRACTTPISPTTQVVKQEFLLWGESSNGSTGIARPTATSALACFRMGGSGSASEAWTARTPGHNITQSIASPGTSLLMVSG